MRIEACEGVSASRKHLVFAYYVTGHGFGHATRVVEVVRNLILAGHDVHVVTGAPDFVFTSEIQSPRLFIRKVLLDCGAVQADALTVDRLASLEKYSETAVKPRESILATEIEWLNSIKADLVVSDVVPVVCRAAADAGIRSVCVTNFSWDFIYAEYVMATGNHHRSIVWQVTLFLWNSFPLILIIVSVLGALLGACKIHGAIILGNEVGSRLVELQRHHCGQHVALSGIHAGVDRWGVAADIRKTMAEARIRKVPACCLIDCI
ncbi:hypothetical protein OIU84_000072 [Salix udensis]|uniref:L-arabinokinase n=1 Tax=Salix udensis TaxID=889485 RepID=A0AAD6L3U2_9ROSI|nr:hypothetical protein OIU84_000072 [Salix udensis]